MEEKVGEILGGIAGKKLVEKFGSDFEALKKSLDHLFSWERDFKLEVKEDSIVSSGYCPVKRFYPNYCKKGCIVFITKFARYFNAKVERVSVDPCTFEFKI